MEEEDVSLKDCSGDALGREFDALIDNHVHEGVHQSTLVLVCGAQSIGVNPVAEEEEGDDEFLDLESEGLVAGLEHLKEELDGEEVEDAASPPVFPTRGLSLKRGTFFTAAAAPAAAPVGD